MVLDVLCASSLLGALFGMPLSAPVTQYSQSTRSNTQVIEMHADGPDGTEQVTAFTLPTQPKANGKKIRMVGRSATGSEIVLEIELCDGKCGIPLPSEDPEHDQFGRGNLFVDKQSLGKNLECAVTVI